MDIDRDLWLRGQQRLPRYRLSDAARLAGISRPRARAWLGRSMGAGVSFLDLVELHAVQAFLAAGVRMKQLRAAVGGLDYPLAKRSFYADPTAPARAILAAHIGSQADGVIAQLAGRFAFDADGTAELYYPTEDRSVELTPFRGFGCPVLRGRSLKTAVLAGMARAGDAVELLASLYDTSEQEVEAAVRFERGLEA
jgi:uncharacterized protein (DUF433 family)